MMLAEASYDPNAGLSRQQRRNSFRAVMSTALESSFLLLEKTPSPISPRSVPLHRQPSMASSMASTSSSAGFTPNYSQSSFQSSIPGIPDEFRGPPEPFPSVGAGRHRRLPSDLHRVSSESSANSAKSQTPGQVRVVGRGGAGSKPRAPKHVVVTSTTTTTSSASSMSPSHSDFLPSVLKDGKPAVRVMGRGGSGSSHRKISTKGLKSKPSLPSVLEHHDRYPAPQSASRPHEASGSSNSHIYPPPVPKIVTSIPSSVPAKPPIVRYGGRGGAGSKPRQLDSTPKLKIPSRWKMKSTAKANSKGKERARSDSLPSSVDSRPIVGDAASEVSSMHFAPVALPKPVPPPRQPYSDTAYDEPPPPSPADAQPSSASIHSISSVETDTPPLPPVRRRHKLAQTLGEDVDREFVFVKSKREAVRMSGRMVKPSLVLTSRPLPPLPHPKPPHRHFLSTDRKADIATIPMDDLTRRDSESELESVDDAYNLVRQRADPGARRSALEKDAKKADHLYEQKEDDEDDNFSMIPPNYPFSRPDSPFSNAFVPIDHPSSLDSVLKQTAHGEDAFVVSRDETRASHGWVGQWNRRDIRDVVSALRDL